MHDSCKGCGSPMIKGHWWVCTMWFMAKAFLVFGFVAAATAVYLNSTDGVWMWYDANAMYHKATIFLLLSIICRLCYRDCKKGLMKKSMGGGCGDGGCDSGGCGGGSCGSDTGGGCCGGDEHKH